jgi:hypothetical protein
MMMDQAGGDGGAARVIRIRDLGRMVAVSPPRANDNRRRLERPAMPLARLALAATAGGDDRGASRDPGGDGRRAGSTAAAVPAALGAGWLAPQIALWSAGLGAASRFPAVASGLALYRAWSEVGLAGAASCASVAASGIELVGAAVMGTLAAATPAATRAARRPDR